MLGPKFSASLWVLAQSEHLLARLDRGALRQAQAEMDVLAAQRLVQDLLAA